MATPRFPRLLNRRSFMKLAGTGAAALGAALTNLRSVGALPRPARTRWVYYLEPDCGTDPRVCAHPTTVGGHDCTGCKFCQSHAANKRWTHRRVVWRAHECCRCTVRRMRVPATEFEQMFGKGRAYRHEFDARRVALA